MKTPKDTIIREVIKTHYSEPFFTAGRILPDGGTPISFSGKFGVSEGQVVTLSGRWSNHPKYGRQFEADSVSLTIPPTLEGMMHYIRRDKHFKGIGPVYAEKLVTYCFEQHKGDMDTMVSNGIKEVGKVLSIPESAIETFSEAWKEFSDINSERTFLASFELTPHQIDEIMSIKPSIVGLIQENPYLISDHLAGWGFKKCDEVAMKLGISKTHAGRVRAGIEHTVKESINSGNTWIEASTLLKDAEKLLIMDTFDSMERIKSEAFKLIEEETLVNVQTAGKNCITYKWMHNAEAVIHDTFTQTEFVRKPIDIDIPDGLTDGQRDAFIKAFEWPYSIISGGAGTGKTHVVGQIVTAMQQIGKGVILAAPTGKAARRMSELLMERYGQNVGASTIHRLLGYNGTEFLEDEVPGDTIILDEFSMVDVELFFALLSRMKPEQRLILVGDHNQLPSVGPGSILRDLISYDEIPATILDQVMRQAGILKTNSMAVLEGKVGKTDENVAEWIVFDQYGMAETMALPLRDMVMQHIPTQFDIDIFTDLQVITPTHKGAVGTKGLNDLFQKAFNEATPSRKDSKLKGFHVGDKVMQTKNDYNLGIMNGTQGLVTSIGDKSMEVDFFGVEKIEISESKQFDNLRLSYAITCHKAQGSEWPVVIVVLHKSHFFADRNWLYTAVTRASKTCIIMGDVWGIRQAARKDSAERRNTFLDLWNE